MKKKMLVLTIGTGDVEKIDESLLKPLSKSIRQGEWSRVILLPSTITENLAEQLTQRLSDLPIGVESLPKPGMENDADACFGHFDTVLGNLIEEGCQAGSIFIDFTRGTKAMSAALVLAAVRHDIPQLRYIYGERDKRGMVIAGTEEISDLSTTLATARRQLDTAINLMRRGNFAAVLELGNQFAEFLPQEFHDEAAGLRRRAYFYAAWDRLDYKEAARRAESLRKEDVIADQTEWVRQLAKEPDKSEHEAMTHWLQIVACDLLENGRRRIRNRHFEDALLRGYRVLELTGQFLLFKQGIDSESIDPDIPAVKHLQGELEKKGSHGFGCDKNGRFKAPRELAARLLKRLDEPLAKDLLHFDNEHTRVEARQRNRSILIHGFTATSGSDASALDKLYDDLESLLNKSCSEVVSRAKSATDPFARN